MNRRTLVISFSGGKTSAFMTLFCLKAFRDIEIVIVFANTGQEHEKTLEYVRNFAAHHGIRVVWVEAVFDQRKGFGVRHREVTFETASRNGEPFEDMIRKHGLPNSQFPHCTRELKERVIASYLTSLGLKNGDYELAIGIRADEMDRQSARAAAKGIVYPLIDAGVTKEEVLEWELNHPVRLGIPEHLGNCVWCWKKSFRKLATVAIEAPESFEFPRRMEAQYPDTGAGFGDRRMFRGRKTVSDIFKMAKEPDFVKYTDSHQWSEVLDVGAACGESCEIGADSYDEAI